MPLLISRHIKYAFTNKVHMRFITRFLIQQNDKQWQLVIQLGGVSREIHVLKSLYLTRCFFSYSELID